MKRFTETNKWDDPWFRSLAGVHKLIFLYVIDRCNNAGFWEVDEAGMAFQTKLSESHISGAWQGLARGLIHADGWVWVRRFLRHQKNENLNPENNAHLQIITLISEQVDRFEGVAEFDEFLAPHQPLIRGSGKGKGKGKKGSAEGKHLPEPPAQLVEQNGFIAAWEEFVQHRKEIGKKLTTLAAQRILSSLLERPKDSVMALGIAVRRGWQGIEWAWIDKDRPQAPEDVVPDAFRAPMNKPPTRPEHS